MAGSTSHPTGYDPSAHTEHDRGVGAIRDVRPVLPPAPRLSDLTALLELHGWQEVTS